MTSRVGRWPRGVPEGRRELLFQLESRDVHAGYDYTQYSSLHRKLTRLQLGPLLLRDAHILVLHASLCENEAGELSTRTYWEIRQLVGGHVLQSYISFPCTSIR